MAKRTEATPANQYGTGRTLLVRGDRVAVCRERAGLSQGQLASMIGVSQSTISLWERGLKHPASDAFVWALAAALNVKPARIASQVVAA